MADDSYDLDSDVDLLSEDLPDDKEIVADDEDNDLVPDPSKSKVKDEKEEEEDEEKEEEDVKEDKPIYNRPKLKDISTKYPGIFKDFPQIKTALFREEEYTKIFPTVEDAVKAADDYQAYEELSDSVLNGDASGFIKALDKTEETGNFSVKYLQTLQKQNPDLHYRVLAPYLATAAKSFYNFGVKNNNEDIKNAAEFFAHFLFEDVEIAKGKAYEGGIKVKEEDPELKKEKNRYHKERSTEFTNSTLTDLADQLGALIDKGLPKDIDSEIKDTIHQRIVQHLDVELQKDPAYMKLMGSLWKNADGSAAARSRIISAYLARAAKPLAAKRRELKIKFLGYKENEQLRQTANMNASRREGGSPSRVSNGRGMQVKNPKAIDWKHTSDLDFLNDKVALKK